MEINGITITNIKTYAKLKEIFKGKNPTPRTVLILKLFINGDLTKEEANLLNISRYRRSVEVKGGGFRILKLAEVDYNRIL